MKGHAIPTSDIARLALVRAQGDDASFGPAYQTGLRQFFYLVRAEGTKISASARSADSIGCGATPASFSLLKCK
jgi:hypothetical protein